MTDDEYISMPSEFANAANKAGLIARLMTEAVEVTETIDESTLEDYANASEEELTVLHARAEEAMQVVVTSCHRSAELLRYNGDGR
jgi:hypothetical protein